MTAARQGEFNRGFRPIETAKQSGFRQVGQRGHGFEREILSGEVAGSSLGIELLNVNRDSSLIHAARFGIGGLGEAAGLRLHLLGDGELDSISGINEEDIDQIRLRYTRRFDRHLTPRIGIYYADYRLVIDNQDAAVLEGITLWEPLVTKGRSGSEQEQRHWIMTKVEFEFKEVGIERFLDETGLPERVNLRETVEWWTGGVIIDQNGQLIKLTPEAFAINPLRPLAE